MNKPFTIDPQLKSDTVTLGYLNGQTLLLANNILVPWFILVPNTYKTELFTLETLERSILSDNVNLLSAFILEHFESTKLNIASIGNVVRQMHIHIVGRHEQDFCWPNVVWGQPNKIPYDNVKVEAIVALLKQQLGDVFRA